MEYITANGTEYKCKSVATGIDCISFIMEGQDISNIEAAFKGVTELTVSGEDRAVYGSYEHLSFESATVYENKSISVTMHIQSDMEIRMAELEATQADQDEAIAELMYGGDVK